MKERRICAGKSCFRPRWRLLSAGFAVAPSAAQAHGDLVTVRDSYLPGTIVIRTNERAPLLLLVGPGQALRYPVGVGRLGMQWSGTAFYRRQIYQAGLGSRRSRPARTIPGCREGGAGRLAAKSDGRRGP